MERALPALRPLPWRRAAIIAALLLGAAVNVVLLAMLFARFGNVIGFSDWSQLNALDRTDPYANGFYRWAPPAIYLWQWLVTPLGFWLWAGLHFVAMAALRDVRAVALVLLTFPFWFDVANGSVLTLILLAAWWALRGSRIGVIAYVALFALMPRPLMLPVLAWLVWHRTDARVALVAVGLAVDGISLWSGLLDDWLGRLLVTGGREAASLWNIAPWAPLGAWWLPIGAGLAAWLTWKGRMGLASIVASPYLLPYYGVMLALERIRLSAAR